MKNVLKNWKSVCSISAMSFVSVLSFAQEAEILSNGSFEATDGKVKKLGSIESATGWTSPTGVRADLFVPNKNPEVNTPINKYGKEEAKTGTNYAGIVAYSYGNKVPRSYIMAKFDTPLKKGMKYCVEFNVSLSEASKYASNSISAMLTKKDFATESKGHLIEDKVSIQHYVNKIFNATYNWEKVCGVFVAEGGEKYITIGNFTKDDKVKQEPNKMKKDKNLKVDQVIAAYYFIDDVSVKLIEKEDECDCRLSESTEEFSTTIFQRAFEVNDKMTPQEKVELQRLYFAFGKTAFTSEAEQSLDLIADQLKANPNMKLEIFGHNNPKEVEVGEEREAYKDLDARRVNAAINYLKEKGIAENRLIATAMGSTEDSDEIAPEDDEELKMAKSRRVTFRIR